MNPNMQSSLATIAKWGKFLGYLWIVCGAISAIAGLFYFVVGAIPGIISIFLGIYILRSAKEAKTLQIQFEEVPLNELMLNYAKFLKLQGIYNIVAIILSIVLVVVSIIFLVAFGESLMMY